jgi:hypothetical protein
LRKNDWGVDKNLNDQVIEVNVGDSLKLVGLVNLGVIVIACNKDKKEKKYEKGPH